MSKNKRIPLYFRGIRGGVVVIRLGFREILLKCCIYRGLRGFLKSLMGKHLERIREGRCRFRRVLEHLLDLRRSRLDWVSLVLYMGWRR